MGKEEQTEEREVLDSIFPDEITDVSDSEYKIKITLDIPNEPQPDDPDTIVEPPFFYLIVRYPDDYPDIAPHLDLTPPDDDGASRHPLFNVADDKAELLQNLEATVEENLGMAMVFTLVTTLKEEAEQLVVRRREVETKAQEEVALAAEREENKKFHGTPVTRETFLSWRDGFMKEMEEAEKKEEDDKVAELKKARVVVGPVKLTGRQLWERGLAKGEEVEEEDDAPVEDLTKLKIAA